MPSYDYYSLPKRPPFLVKYWWCVGLLGCCHIPFSLTLRGFISKECGWISWLYAQRFGRGNAQYWQQSWLGYKTIDIMGFHHKHIPLVYTDTYMFVFICVCSGEMWSFTGHHVLKSLSAFHKGCTTDANRKCLPHMVVDLLSLICTISYKWENSTLTHAWTNFEQEIEDYLGKFPVISVENVQYCCEVKLIWLMNVG